MLAGSSPFFVCSSYVEGRGELSICVLALSDSGFLVTPAPRNSFREFTTF